MSTLTLSRTEAKILTLAASQPNGQILLPPHLKPVTAKRLIAKLLKHELVVPRNRDDQAGHALTPGGYRAVGLEPPVATSADAAATKRARVIGLLRRSEGASLLELIALTGWLPHTTRAALSRLRSGGRHLVKSTREDGSTAYRIVTFELDKPKPPRRPARRTISAVRVAADASASAGAAAA